MVTRPPRLEGAAPRGARQVPCSRGVGWAWPGSPAAGPFQLEARSLSPRRAVGGDALPQRWARPGGHRSPGRFARSERPGRALSVTEDAGSSGRDRPGRRGSPAAGAALPLAPPRLSPCAPCEWEAGPSVRALGADWPAGFWGGVKGGVRRPRLPGVSCSDLDALRWVVRRDFTARAAAWS